MDMDTVHLERNTYCTLINIPPTHTHTHTSIKSFTICKASPWNLTNHLPLCNASQWNLTNHLPLCNASPWNLTNDLPLCKASPCNLTNHLPLCKASPCNLTNHLQLCKASPCNLTNHLPLCKVSLRSSSTLCHNFMWGISERLVCDHTLAQWLAHSPSNQGVQCSNLTLDCLDSKCLKRSIFALGSH